MKEETAWNNGRAELTGWVCVCVCVCVHVCHSSIASACALGKWKVTDIVWHCESCRFLSIIPHQGHIHRLKVVALAFSTPGSGRGMGPAEPLLLLIRADAWLSCMPAAQPNRDYVPGWWRQKKKKKRSLLRSLSLYTFGEFVLFNYLCLILMKMKYLDNCNSAHNTRHIAGSLIVRVVTPAAYCWLSYNLGHCATCF